MLIIHRSGVRNEFLRVLGNATYLHKRLHGIMINKALVERFVQRIRRERERMHLQNMLSSTLKSTTLSLTMLLCFCWPLEIMLSCCHLLKSLKNNKDNFWLLAGGGLL